MNSRERILTALSLKQPDRVPFADDVDEGLKKKIMEIENFSEAEFAQKMGLDAIAIYEYCAPDFCQETGSNFHGEGLLKCEKDLSKMVFPNPNDENFYDDAKQFVDQYGNENLGLFAYIRPGVMNTLLSIGWMDFANALYNDIKLIENIFERYIEWNCIVVEKLQTIGIDFFVACDDVAFNNGPMMSPQVFREIFIPRYKPLIETFKIPWVFHSDGDISLLLDDLITLGMNGLNPIQPDVMSIKDVKEKYGNKLCLWGNVDLSYTLTRGTPEEVDLEVKQCIKDAGLNGGYICASANSLTDYCKVENVWALSKAIKKYGKYPLNLK
jgi:uroporphyrinogen decarboxylase